MKNEKLVVGIDCSSTICGYTILKNKEVINYGYHEFDTDKDVLYRAYEFEEFILPKIEHGDVFILEDMLKAYAGGRTSSQTIMTLAHVNGNVEFILSKLNGVENIHKIHPSTARKLGIGRGRAPKGVDTKEWVINEIKQRYPDMHLPRNPRSRKTPKNYMNYVNDVCDATVLALSYYNR